MPRTTKLDATVSAAICGRLGKGKPVKVSVLLAGVGESTYYLWLERGEAERARVEVEDKAIDDGTMTAQDCADLRAEQGEPDRKAESLYLAFLEDVEAARILAQERYLNRIDDIAINEEGQVSFNAAKWRLQLLDRDTYADNPGRTELTGANGGAIEIEHSPMDLLALADELTGGYSDADEDDV